jgi:hypothetical protein
MEPKSQGVYEGTSRDGDLRAALADAIAAAKNDLRTDWVRWKLVEVSGENGGFAVVNDLTVCIEAQGPGESGQSVPQQPSSA